MAYVHEFNYEGVDVEAVIHHDGEREIVVPWSHELTEDLMAAAHRELDEIEAGWKAEHEEGMSRIRAQAGAFRAERMADMGMDVPAR